LPAAAQTNFGSVKLGGSAELTVTVPVSSVNLLSSIRVVTQGAPNLDFTAAVGGSCATGSAYAASCTVAVTFAPKFVGVRYGAVILEDASGVVGTAYLQGTGVGPQTIYLPGGQSTVASFTPSISWTSAVAVNGGGNLFITDYDRFSDGLARLYNEKLSAGSYSQSVVPVSAMSGPYGVAVDGAGYIYITDTDNFRVLKEMPWAGGYAESTVASFVHIDGSAPIGVAVDGGGNVYISLGAADGTVVKESLTASGYLQSTVVSGLPSVAGVAVDGSGNVYAAVNETDGWVVMETPTATGYAQSTIAVPGQGLPFALAIDGTGNLLIAYIDNNDNGEIFKILNAKDAYFKSTIDVSGLDQPMGIAVDATSSIYIADSYNSRVVKAAYADLPSLNFAATPLGTTSTDSPQTIVVSNVGSEVVTFSGLFYLSDFPEAAGVATDCASTTVLAPGGTCTLSIDFLPNIPLGGNSVAAVGGSVTFNTSTPSTGTTQNTVMLSGLETPPSTSTTGTLTAAATPHLSLASGTFSSAQSLSISDSTSGAAIYYTTNGDTPSSSSTPYYSGTMISVSSTVTIKAIAVASGYLNSAIASATYTINLPQPDFTVSTTPASVAASTEQGGSTVISITPLNGFNSSVSFSCTEGLPAGDSCSFSPQTVTPSGAAVSTTLTVNTHAVTQSQNRNSTPLLPGSVLAVALCGFGWKKKRRLQMLLLLAISVCGMSLVTGCNEMPFYSPSSTSWVTVTATSGSLTHTTSFSYTSR